MEIKSMKFKETEIKGMKIEPVELLLIMEIILVLGYLKISKKEEG